MGAGDEAGDPVAGRLAQLEDQQAARVPRPAPVWQKASLPLPGLGAQGAATNRHDPAEVAAHSALVRDL